VVCDTCRTRYCDPCAKHTTRYYAYEKRTFCDACDNHAGAVREPTEAELLAFIFENGVAAAADKTETVRRWKAHRRAVAIACGRCGFSECAHAAQHVGDVVEQDLGGTVTGIGFCCACLALVEGGRRTDCSDDGWCRACERNTERWTMREETMRADEEDAVAHLQLMKRRARIRATLRHVVLPTTQWKEQRGKKRPSHDHQDTDTPSPVLEDIFPLAPGK
jgi:hypothetical protein